MIELAKHIEILLLDNECVIVPELGGFITHYQPAHYEESEGLFVPPVRTVGFNSQLTMNDGLLIQSYMQAYHTDFSDAARIISEKVEWLKENTSFESFNWEAITEKAINFVGNGLKTVMERAFSYIGSFSTGVFNAVVSFVFSIYCLCRKERLSRQGRKLLYAFIPEKAGDEVVRIMRLTNATFSNFISGQCIEAVILGLMFVVAMLIFRMPYVALISVTIAVTALIPIVGAFAGCIVGAFFILIDDPVKAVWFVIMFLVLQQIEGNLIYPKVVGKSVGLPGMWVLVAVSVGGELMGVAGMFIMIPLMAVIYTLLGEITTKLVVKKGIDQDKLTDHAPDLGVQAHHRLFKFKKRKKKQAEIVEAVDNQEEQ